MSQRLSISANKQGLVIEGDLVYATVSSVLEPAKKLLLAHQAQSLTVDCGALNKFDSAGIALLVEWKRWCHQNKKEFYLLGIKENAFSLISTYRLKTILGLNINRDALN